MTDRSVRVEKETPVGGEAKGQIKSEKQVEKGVNGERGELLSPFSLLLIRY